MREAVGTRRSEWGEAHGLHQESSCTGSRDLKRHHTMFLRMSLGAACYTTGKTEPGKRRLSTANHRRGHDGARGAGTPALELREGRGAETPGLVSSGDRKGDGVTGHRVFRQTTRRHTVGLRGKSDGGKRSWRGHPRIQAAKVPNKTFPSDQGHKNVGPIKTKEWTWRAACWHLKVEPAALLRLPPDM